MIRFSLILALPLALALGGCWKINPLYCDEETPCTDPARSFCDLLGQHEASDGLAKTCIAPPMGACNAAQPCEQDQLCAPSGVCVECLNESDCVTAEAPFCPAGGGSCFSCEPGAAGDSFCVELDPGRPFCAAGAGCVECLDATVCSAAAPVCDPDAGSCRACLAHPECASEICEIGAGTCVDEDAIVHVAPAPAGENSPTCGTRAAPCATIQQGNDSALDKLNGDRRFVHLAAGNYPEVLDLSDLTVTLVAPFRNAILNPSLAALQPAIEIEGAAQITLDGVTIAPTSGGADSHGIAAAGSVNGNPTLTLRNATLRNASGVGLRAQNATVTLEASHVLKNLGGGVSLQNTSFVLQNNVIAQNGQGGVSGTLFGGVSIANSGAFTQVFEHNTVADNLALAGQPAGIACTTSMSAILRSNIAYNTTDSPLQLAGNCAHTFSNIQGGASAENDNIDADPMFVNPVESDYHLGAGSPCIGAADPAATVTTDIDGDSRPQGDGFDIGADEFVAE